MTRRVLHQTMVWMLGWVWMAAAGWADTQPADGERALVRIYDARSTDPAAFVAMAMPIRDGRLQVPRDQVPADAVLALVGWDQDDAGLLIPEAADVLIFDPETLVRLPWRRSFLWDPGTASNPENLGHPQLAWLADALGRPLTVHGVRLTVLLRTPGGNRSFVEAVRDPVRTIVLDDLPTDAQGRTIGPRISLLDRSGAPEVASACGLLFEVPGYGSTLESLQSPFRRGSCRLPLVARDSPEWERAFHGRVLDRDGRPLAGAIVQARALRATRNGAFITGDDGFGFACGVTDADGQFALYHRLPAPEAMGSDGFAAIPLGASASFTVWAPRECPYLPLEGEADNRAPVTFAFSPRATFHRLVFLNPQGEPEEPKRSQIQYTEPTQPPGFYSVLTLPRFLLSQGGYIPEGTYWIGGYEPITIDASAPRDVVFRPKPSLRYRGRVVDGRTSQPLSSVVVLAVKGIVASGAGGHERDALDRAQPDDRDQAFFRR